MSLYEELTGIGSLDARRVARAEFMNLYALSTPEAASTIVDRVNVSPALAMIRKTITDEMRRTGAPEAEVDAASMAMIMMGGALLTLADMQTLPTIE